MSSGNASPQFTHNQIGAPSGPDPARVIAVLAMVLIICMMLVWPGLLSYWWKVKPWPPNDVTSQTINAGKTPLCDENGKLTAVGRTVVVNRLAFWDDLCSTSFTDPNNPCDTETGQPVAYLGCGLMSRDTSTGSLMCDDPDFLTAYDNFKTRGGACAKLVGQNFARCNSIDVAAEIFLQPTTGLSKPYNGCTPCSTATDASSPLFGLSVTDGATCSVDQVSMDYYLKFNPDVPATSTSPPLEKCTDTELNNGCVDSMDTFAKLSPGDCLDPAYQLRKTTFVKALNACNTLKSTLPTSGQSAFADQPLSNYCPLKVAQFFAKCDSTTYDCTYTPVGCTRDTEGTLTCPDTVSDTKQKACSNDYTNCTDASYLKDEAVEAEYEAKCTARVTNYKNRNKIVIGVMGALYASLFLAIIVICIVSRQSLHLRVGQLGTNQNIFQQQMNGTYTQMIIREVLIFLMVMWFIVAVPVGLLAQGYRLFVYSGSMDAVEQANFDSSKTVVRILGWVLTGITTASIITLAFVLLVRGTTGEFQPSSGISRAQADAEAKLILAQGKILAADKKSPPSRTNSSNNSDPGNLQQQ